MQVDIEEDNLVLIQTVAMVIASVAGVPSSLQIMPPLSYKYHWKYNNTIYNSPYKLTTLFYIFVLQFCRL